MGLIVLIIDCRPLTEAKTLRQQHAATNRKDSRISLQYLYVMVAYFQANL